MSGDCAGERAREAAADAGPTLERLHRLLEEQLELARQGRLAAVESLCEQTGPLVQTVVAAGTLDGPDAGERRQALLHLYQELCLTLTAQREEVSAALRVVSQGRRTLRTYRNSPV
jgi:hypothetical protein